jgi:putative oxidoreductase
MATVMKNQNNYSQLYLRLAIGLGFIYAVLDRVGLAGAAGQPNIAWGNWTSFLDYTHVLMPVLSKPLSDAMGLVATIAEVLFGVLLIAGFKTRLAAIGSGLLTLAFALSMVITLGLKAPFNYSVFAVSAGAFLLAGLPNYSWSIDGLLKKQ